MGFKYAQVGPPFPFAGNLSETQRDAFLAWVKGRVSALPGVQVFHQIRAQQLRKTAGMMEKFYASTAPPEPLAPSFVKTAWKPTTASHFAHRQANDHEPGVVVAQIKAHFISDHTRMDDAIFNMNQVRVQIERHEDKAQQANEGTQKVNNLCNQLNVLFGQPEYQETLVKDKTNSYKGQPLNRVNPFDDPTPWELDTQTGHTPDLTQLSA